MHAHKHFEGMLGNYGAPVKMNKRHAHITQHAH